VVSSGLDVLRRSVDDLVQVWVYGDGIGGCRFGRDVRGGV
jgi:hypothetical protein